MKHLEIEIMDYVGNEMDAVSRSKFEKRMNTSPELKQMVEEILSTQAGLKNWKDEDIEVPQYDTPEETQAVNRSQVHRIGRLPSWIRYVAAAAVILGLGWVSGFQVNHTGNTLSFSFGEPNGIVNLDEQVNRMVADAIQNYSHSQNQQLLDFQNQISENLSNIQSSVNNVAADFKTENKKLKSSLNLRSSEQYAQLTQMIRGIEDQQRQDIEGSMTALVQYWDNERSADLFKIENAFNEVAAAINNQQNKTDAIFSSLSEPVAVSTNY